LRAGMIPCPRTHTLRNAARRGINVLALKEGGSTLAFQYSDAVGLPDHRVRSCDSTHIGCSDGGEIV